MPSVSGPQARLMALCSTLKGRRKARGKCPDIKTAREFHAADKALARQRKGHLARVLKRKQ